jgi:hypothetical protein
MTQLRVLALVTMGALALACSDEPQSKRRGGPGGATAGGTTPGGSSGGVLPAGPSCPPNLPAPASIATDAEATDVRVVGDTIYFRVGTKLVRVGRDGAGRKDVYTSENLIRTFVSGKTFVAVESPDPPNAVLRIGDIGAEPGALDEINTDLVAAGFVVFGADDASVYAVADNAGGDSIYKVGKENAGGVEVVTETGGVVTDPQLAGGALWYVKDQKEIYKLPLAGGEPALLATVEAGCNLAVGTAHLFCSSGGTVEQRDLSGANPTKLFDTETSKVKLGFGPGVATADSMILRSSGEGPLKSVLRSVASGSAERVIACGRDPIGALSVDGQAVAWTEAGKGVFLTVMGPL